ncbi:CPBP family intramembrane glutamic endopeptidase [Paraflavisolibacter sp. H34]|uniref:CPBP family intramembrane glutamic endopeptidase n=1 Tax=Huijunlia imazamoxiresistens TaxID=3127457 RepID=UPI00301A5E03
MKTIAGYLKEYIVGVEKPVLALSALFIALAIFVNYYHGLNRHISTLSDPGQFGSWYAVFLSAFSFPYLLAQAGGRKRYFHYPRFVALLLIAPALFAWKMAFTSQFAFSPHLYENAYWNQVADWPFKLLVFLAALLLLWRVFDRDQPFYGLTTRGFHAKPYLLMLLLMLPLLAAASTQPDFLAVYPKLKNILYLSGRHSNPFYQLLYELAYGSDFLSIELFFRGFMVLAFARWAGRDAILPMALFYCTIHFGKPLGECISSFFGGLILGVVTYHTRTILGGLVVHLGIAWLMELGGYLGNNMHHS